jgi:MFS family permease
VTARRPFRALAHRNFRLFCVGQGVSLIGTWAQQVAAAWLVYQLTGSPLWLGLVAFAGQIPSFFLAPVAGVFVDRLPRRRLLLVTQTLAMLQAFGLAALALTGAVEVWHVVVLNVALGAVTAFDMTARQVFLTELVATREDTANAIALNSSLVNGARLLGPAVAGFAVAHAGAGVCFLVNGASYVAVLAVLFAIAVLGRAVPPRGRVWHELGEGLRYAFGFTPIRSLLSLLAVMSVAGAAQTTILPVVAANLPGGGPDTFGLLAAASGVGALAAALVLAARVSVVGLGRWLAAAPALFGAALVGLSFAGSVFTAAAALALAGFAVMTHMAASNTVLQTVAEEAKRGRVMSLYTAAFYGAAPLGSLAAGALAESAGLAPALWAVAGVGVAASAVFALRLPRLRELVRPIYVRLGILPEPGAAGPSTPVIVLPAAGK